MGKAEASRLSSLAEREMEQKKQNIGNEPGFHSPLGKQAQKGDAANASPVATPTGPPPDPIGNVRDKRPGSSTNLPLKRNR